MNAIAPRFTRETITALENEIRSLPEVDMPVRHFFAHGTYTRELTIPAGTALTGKVHRYSCINILTKGRIRVVSDEGVYDLEAPYVFVSGPDVKKAGYAIEESIWINVHPWDGEMNLEQIEDQVIIPEQTRLSEGVCLGEL